MNSELMITFWREKYEKAQKEVEYLKQQLEIERKRSDVLADLCDDNNIIVEDDNCMKICVGCGTFGEVYEDFYGDDMCKNCYDPDEEEKYNEYVDDSGCDSDVIIDNIATTMAANIIATSPTRVYDLMEADQSEEEEEEEICYKCKEEDGEQCWECDKYICCDCDEGGMRTCEADDHTYCNDCFPDQDGDKCQMCEAGPRECDCDKCGETGCYECVTGGHGENLCPECLSDSDDDEFTQICGDDDCDRVLDENCPIMCWNDGTNEKTLCSDCWFHPKWWKSDKNEDNEEEIADRREANQCIAVTKRGKRCKNPTFAGDCCKRHQ